MTKDEAKQFLIMIQATWSRFEITTKTIGAWCSPLADIAFEDCVKALKRYQNPKNDEEAKRCAFAPHPGDIYALCKEIERDRLSVESEVRSCARRAVDNFPSNGEQEREQAKGMFYGKCMEQREPVKCARALEHELDELRILAAKVEMTNYLKPVTQIINEAPVYDK